MTLDESLDFINFLKICMEDGYLNNGMAVPKEDSQKIEDIKNDLTKYNNISKETTNLKQKILTQFDEKFEYHTGDYHQGVIDVLDHLEKIFKNL